MAKEPARKKPAGKKPATKKTVSKKPAARKKPAAAKSKRTRAPVSPGVEDSILIRCQRVCSMCFGIERDPREKFLGQIAHVDRDASNSEEDNLAWLCLAHHALYDGKYTQVKAYRPAELEHWRSLTHQAVREGIAPNAYSGPGAALGIEVGIVELWVGRHFVDLELIEVFGVVHPIQHFYRVQLTIWNQGQAATGIRSVSLFGDGAIMATHEALPDDAVYVSEDTARRIQMGETKRGRGVYHGPIKGTHYLTCGRGELIVPGESGRFTVPLLGDAKFKTDNCAVVELTSPFRLDIVPVIGAPVAADIGEVFSIHEDFTEITRQGPFYVANGEIQVADGV